MTLEVRSISAEDYAPLTFDAAVQLTEDIRLSVADIELKIIEAYYGRAWSALDYESWDAYVAGEFKTAPLAMPREDRKAQVASLRSQGLSLRAIGAVTGTSEATVHSDLAGVQNLTPASITGIDGKAYPASRPDQVIEVSQPETNNTPPERREACPTCGQIMPIDLRKGD